jgi:CTP:molybdopterin cytidylyltransferase MocA
MESGEDRVRRELAHLGTDAASAPDVPAGLTARIGAALRAAPQPAAHTTTAGRPRLSRLRIVALVAGVGAAAAVVVVGVVTLLHSAPAAPAFPSGPTAERITVSAPKSSGDMPKAVVTRR